MRYSRLRAAEQEHQYFFRQVLNGMSDCIGGHKATSAWFPNPSRYEVIGTEA